MSFLDEVHKYPDWSREIKNILADFPELKVVFTGSLILEIALIIISLDVNNI